MRQLLLCVAICCFILLTQADGLEKKNVVQIQNNDLATKQLSLDENGPKNEKKNVNVTSNVYIIDDDPQQEGPKKRLIDYLKNPLFETKMDDFSTTVIVDVGGHEIRFGTSDSEMPSLICSSCIEKKLYTIKNKALVSESPWYENAVENGIIKNWSIIEDFMKHFINSNNIEPNKCAIIFTQSLASTEKDKEKAMDMLFDKFNFHSVCITSDAYLSFIASGKSTGCIVQLGHSITQFLPIIDDKPRLSEAKWFNIGGSDISKLLIDEADLPFDLDRASPVAQQKLNNFKETNCFIAADYKEELKKHASDEGRPESPQYLKFLKDSPVARMCQKLQKHSSKAIFEAPEILFEPSIAGKKDYGIAEQLYEMIGSVKPMGYHGLLYSNIILSGGTAKLKGLKERFAAEIDGYSPKLSKINVTLASDAPELEDDVEEGYVSTSTHDKSEISSNTVDPSLAAFKGATILAHRPDFASSVLMAKEDRPNLRRNRSHASVRSIRSSSYRKSSTHLFPDFNERHE